MKANVSDKAAGKIAKLLLKLQIMFAELMQRYVARLSLHQLKVLLVVSCMVAGGFSVWLMVEGIFYPKKMKVMKAERIHVPVHVQKEVEVDVKDGGELLKKIIRQQEVMDSLGINVRQSLLDSIKILKSKL